LVKDPSGRKGFSCKPTWMWASIMDDTRKSSFWAVDYFLSLIRH